MPNNDNNQYQEFSDLFSEEKQNRQINEEKNEFRKKMLPKHLGAIGIYVLVMFILGSVVALLIRTIPGATEKVSPEKQVIENVAVDSDGLAFITINYYHQNEAVYGKYLAKFQYDDQYYIIVNLHNYETFKDLWLLSDEDGNLYLNIEIFDFYLSGNLKDWEVNRPIMLYITSQEFNAHPSFLQDLSTYNHKLIDEEVIQFTSGALSVANLLTYLMILIPVGYLLLPNIKKDWEPFQKKDKQAIISIFTGFAIIYGAALVGGLLQTLVSYAFKIPGGQSQNQIAIELALSGSGLPLMLLTTIILGPIVEELIYRKAIFEVSRNKWIGLTISTLLFSLIHVTNELSNIANFGHFLYVLIPYLTMGLGFSFSYITFKENVITVIGTHMLWNLFASIVSLI